MEAELQEQCAVAGPLCRGVPVGNGGIARKDTAAERRGYRKMVIYFAAAGERISSVETALRSLVCVIRSARVRSFAFAQDDREVGAPADWTQRRGGDYDVSDSFCGRNMVRHLQAPPAFRNSVMGRVWHW